MRLTGKNETTDSISHRLSTNTLSKSKRIHRWGNFIAGFSIEFVEKCLSSVIRQSKREVILDPFSGCGTTLVGARNLGFATIGYELHPIFHAITSAKLRSYNDNDLRRALEYLQKSDCPIYWSADAEKFLTKLFTIENLQLIAAAAGSLKLIESNLKPLSVALFLKACEYACGSQTDGIYKAPTSRKTHIPFDEALAKVASEFKDDITSDWYQEHWRHTPQSLLFQKSATSMDELENNSISCCITSPPYLNNFDYAEMTRMHLYLLGWCSSWRDISETVRNHLITNTTTALRGKKCKTFQREAQDSLPLSLAKQLTPIVANLAEERLIRAGKKEYDYLVYPYYSQITKVLRDVLCALRPGGTIHWVVADAALYGVHIETHEHTATIMKHLGFRNVAVHYLRPRGHRWVLSKRDGAKKGLGEYYLEASK